MNATKTATVDKLPIPTRLPLPDRFDPGTWKVLCEVIFPHVQNPLSIMLALEYCRQRKLDILKRPVNIVPMWSPALRRDVDTIWPAITETQITAARTHQWAGLDPPKYGPSKTETFKGRRKDRDGAWIDSQTTLTFPEWVEVCVWRMVQNVRCPFTERVWWLEAYGRVGGTPLPNPTWEKRPIGMVAKVAKAAALRAAFPEEDSEYTADEMEGQVLPGEHAPTIEHVDAPQIAEPPANDEAKGPPRTLARPTDEAWDHWAHRLLAHIRTAGSLDEIDSWVEANTDLLNAMRSDVPGLHKKAMQNVNTIRVDLHGGGEHTR